MKKIFVLIACLVLTLFTAGVMGADVQTDSALVKYSVGSGYTLIIQDEVTLYDDDGDDEDSYLSIEVNGVKIASDEKIVITVSSEQFDSTISDGDDENGVDGLWRMYSGIGDALYYHVHRVVDGDQVAIKNGGVAYSATCADFLAAKDTGSPGIVKYLFLHLHAGSDKHAGEYTDHLTFTSDVVKIQ
ncbi:MAG: hypothetical protein IKT36_04855 [Methanocorpusculum sp.]|nr:hypothetical protein [Methanocorpusculum sp.]